MENNWLKWARVGAADWIGTAKAALNLLDELAWLNVAKNAGKFRTAALSMS